MKIIIYNRKYIKYLVSNRLNSQDISKNYPKSFAKSQLYGYWLYTGQPSKCKGLDFGCMESQKLFY